MVYNYFLKIQYVCLSFKGVQTFKNYFNDQYNWKCLYLLIYLFIYLFILFLAALGLHCCTWAFSSCGEWGLLFVAVHGLLIALASLFGSTGSRHAGFSSCGTQAQLLRSMWDLPRPGIEPVSPALAGGFLTTATPGKLPH